MRLSPMLPARIQSWTPCREGMSPVSSEARAGEHTGEVQKKFSKRIPAAASRSSTGVLISSLPAQPSAHAPWSSLTMKRTFGRRGSRLAKLSSGAGRSCSRVRSYLDFGFVRGQRRDGAKIVKPRTFRRRVCCEADGAREECRAARRPAPYVVRSTGLDWNNGGDFQPRATGRRTNDKPTAFSCNGSDGDPSCGHRRRPGAIRPEDDQYRLFPGGLAGADHAGAEAAGEEGLQGELGRADPGAPWRGERAGCRATRPELGQQHLRRGDLLAGARRRAV